MVYTITREIQERANKLNIIVKPSTRKGKKLDAYTKAGEYIASFGDINYPDYHIWLRTKGKEYAEERRRLYHIRHKDEAPKSKEGKLTPSYLSKRILW